MALFQCNYHHLMKITIIIRDGVNVTLGLPIVRTSVDHGTAYDIAGRGQARARSLQAAVIMAQDIVANREHHAH